MPISDRERPSSGSYRRTPGTFSLGACSSRYTPAHSPALSRLRGSLGIVLPVPGSFLSCGQMSGRKSLLHHVPPHVGQSTARSWSTEIGCGDWHTIAVRRDGTALATGNNQRGQTDVARWTHVSGGLCRLPTHRRLTRRRHRRRRQRRQQRPVRGVIVEKHHLSGGRLRPYARAEPDRKGLRNGRQPVRPVRCPVMDRHHSDRSRSETLARAAGDHTEQQCNVNAWAARPQMN